MLFILESNSLTLFNFTTVSKLDDWTEQSDTIREEGMSKAVIVIQKTKVFQRAVLFTLLNPQPDGAGFAGVKTNTQLNLLNYTKIIINLRGQGQNAGYKVVLRHKNQNNEPFPSYEQIFQAPVRKFTTVELLLDNFEPYFHGKKQNNTEALDKSNITNFEIQVYGGVYLPVKQYGTSSLEIDWIKAE
ncbi:uncharacterized protein LOC142318756 isoform X2 [Lycorma delicatula]|uniref:uncharacterized protein LOC142318756 isoform X2 n=1 Tax=Lycorma delicatula TaxID=130591 RepID=UPI003F5111F5